MIQEKIILDHLSEYFDIPVGVEKESGWSPPYIIIEKLGSGTENQIESGSFAIQSYHKSMWLTALLNDDVKKCMANLINDERVSSVELDSDYNHTDTETGQYRYQAVYDVVFF